GVGMAMARFAQYPWDGTPAGIPLGIERPKDSGGLPPIVSISEETYDFGFMDADAKGRHEFVFENKGKGPLELKQGASSCKCTVSVLEDGEIAPGESGVVAIEWTAKQSLGGDEFKQTAQILTNDPERPRLTLTIQGRVTVAARAVPSEVLFNGVTAGESGSATVRVFGFRSEPLEITGHELAQADTSDYFEVTYEPLPSDEVSEEEGATSGCRVKVTLKPGLPVGAFKQKIVLKTSSKEVPRIGVPIEGTVTGEISIVGKGWRREDGILHLGSIRSQEGAERTLFIRAGGLHANEVSYKLVEVYPDLLKIEFGETKQLESGKVSLTPLIIQVPKGSRPASHLGTDEKQLGRIILETNHPRVPRLQILLRFAVEG
ncbi:MAG TPA: DUF1573 domain-containing protein, partial [Thermoguttaceae bacterium]|nr:DUF1573 domain-containing protein [Thermoguttaceae bacterium]